MQTGSEQIARQQEVMKCKGFYSGKIDGIWGPKTIAAKKKWELDPSFAPGLPNMGMPFGNKGPYPRGVTSDKVTGLLTCPEYEMHLINSQAGSANPGKTVKVGMGTTEE